MDGSDHIIEIIFASSDAKLAEKAKTRILVLAAQGVTPLSQHVEWSHKDSVYTVTLFYSEDGTDPAGNFKFNSNTDLPSINAFAAVIKKKFSHTLLSKCASEKLSITIDGERLDFQDYATPKKASIEGAQFDGRYCSGSAKTEATRLFVGGKKKKVSGLALVPLIAQALYGPEFSISVINGEYKVEKGEDEKAVSEIFKEVAENFTAVDLSSFTQSNMTDCITAIEEIKQALVNEQTK